MFVPFELSNQLKFYQYGKKPPGFRPYSINFIHDPEKPSVVIKGDFGMPEIHLDQLHWDTLPGKPESIIAGRSAEQIREALNLVTPRDIQNLPKVGSGCNIYRIPYAEFTDLRNIESDDFYFVEDAGWFYWTANPSLFDDQKNCLRTPNGCWLCIDEDLMLAEDRLSVAQSLPAVVVYGLNTTTITLPAVGLTPASSLLVHYTSEGDPYSHPGLSINPKVDSFELVYEGTGPGAEDATNFPALTVYLDYLVRSS